LKRRRTGLVVQMLESIPGLAFKRFPDVVRELAHGRNGVYALYSGDRLYYVGLARDLRSRLKSHLKDRHADEWDRFSLYLTEGDEHLKELESLVLRIADPKGNRVKGKLSGAEDLRPRLMRRVREMQKAELEVFERCGTLETRPGKMKPAKLNVGQHLETSLGRYVSRRFHIRMKFKGKLYVAHVRRNGAISFANDSADYGRLRRKLFKSPSAAAVAAAGRPMNGWWWWKFKTATGDWIRLSELRDGKARPAD
jgi:hypothetical protein